MGKRQNQINVADLNRKAKEKESEESLLTFNQRRITKERIRIRKDFINRKRKNLIC